MRYMHIYIHCVHYFNQSSQQTSEVARDIIPSRWKWKKMKVMSDSVTPWTIARQAALSMEFSRQEYWSGLPCSSRGSSLPRDQTQASYIAGGFFTIWATKEAHSRSIAGKIKASRN